MALERLDRRLGHLGTAQEGALAGLHGAARAALGEQVALARGGGPPRGTGVCEDEDDPSAIMLMRLCLRPDAFDAREALPA